jgi:predicted dehydrogenase
VIGAGNFATRVLLPILKQRNVRLRTIASAGGPSGAIAGAAFDAERITADVDDIVADSSIETVFVLTRHDSHASLVLRALEAGKHVFVEKPLALSEEDLDRIERVARDTDRLLMVGFNRRFAPFSREVASHLAARSGPVALNITVNAGAIPRDHWTQNADVGGGRIVGEACHFIDLARALVGQPIAGVHATPRRHAAESSSTTSLRCRSTSPTGRSHRSSMSPTARSRTRRSASSVSSTVGRW